MNLAEMRGEHKAATILVSLGAEDSARIMRHLNPKEIEKLTIAIANLERISKKNETEVLEEFNNLAMASDYLSQGGVEYARELLDKVLGAKKAKDILDRIIGSKQDTPFGEVRDADPEQVTNFIQGEHPQTIALILSYLEPAQSASILSSLEPGLQIRVGTRIAKMESVNPEVIRELSQLLESKMSKLIMRDVDITDGVEITVEILNRVDRSTEKTILERLEAEEPELAEEIRMKMFVFENITSLQDKDIQLVLREVETADLVLALKVARDEVVETVFRNMSTRQRERIKEDMDYLGPVRLKEVEEAQRRIVSVIRKLDESGDIILSRGGEDELIV